ncbi:MAG: hypothetical protein HPY66_3079 [Firmicutes bacterium]|nr:hypothetical protein [Bacillota bacterium]
MIYCAIIGDIVQSRKIEDRQLIQDRFIGTIDRINQNYNNFIASNFTITLGDEFEGLLFSPSKSYEIIEAVKKQMAPTQLVFGVGIGTMSTQFSKNTSLGSDGPAFHYARKMVNRAKKKKPSICYYSNSPEDELINSLIYFIESCTFEQTKRQKQIIDLYEAGHSQEDIANLVKIKQPSVSEHINNGFYHEIKAAKLSIFSFLKDKYEEYGS